MQELGRIVDQLEEKGMISAYNGSSPRKVLVPKEEWRSAFGYTGYDKYENIIKELDNIKI